MDHSKKMPLRSFLQTGARGLGAWVSAPWWTGPPRPVPRLPEANQTMKSCAAEFVLRYAVDGDAAREKLRMRS